MNKIKVAVVYASRYGHTKAQAEAVARGAASLDGAEVAMYTAAEAVEKIAELDSADAIILGSATYMGNMASEMKVFIEATAGRWASRAWQSKIAGGFANSSNFSGDKLNTLVGMMVAASQLGMIWVSINTMPGENEPEAGKSPEGYSSDALNRNSASLGPMSSSFNVKAPDAPPKGDIETAEKYGRHVAEIAQTFAKGRSA